MRWYSGLRLALGIAGAAARKCQDVSFSLNLSFRNAVFNLAAPASTVDMTNFFLDYTRNGHNYSNELLTGVCPPLDQPNSSNKQITESAPLYVVHHHLKDLHRGSNLLHARLRPSRNHPPDPHPRHHPRPQLLGHPFPQPQLQLRRRRCRPYVVSIKSNTE